jgi:hypothetical protein
MAPSVTAWTHTAFPELRADRPYHQHSDDSWPLTQGTSGASGLGQDGDHAITDGETVAVTQLTEH